jgi:hypothetical protein
MGYIKINFTITYQISVKFKLQLKNMECVREHLKNNFGYSIAGAKFDPSEQISRKINMIKNLSIEFFSVSKSNEFSRALRIFAYLVIKCPCLVTRGKLRHIFKRVREG